MGTIPWSSSHSPIATEAAYGARLLLFDRLHFMIQDLDLQPRAIWFCLLQQSLPAVLLPSLATGLPGRSVIQALIAIPEGSESVSENSVPKLFFSEAL